MVGWRVPRSGRQRRGRGEDAVGIEALLGPLQPGDLVAIGQRGPVALVGAQQIGIAAGHRRRGEGQGQGQTLGPLPVTGGFIRRAPISGIGFPGSDDHDQEMLPTQAEGGGVHGHPRGRAAEVLKHDGGEGRGFGRAAATSSRMTSGVSVETQRVSTA